MRIRRAFPSDGDAVLTLVNKLLVELGGRPVAQDVGRLATELILRDVERGIIALAEESGTFLGLCTLSYQYAVWAGGRYGIIQELFVEPERRGTGIGRQLLTYVMNEAQRAGCRLIEVGTPKDSPHLDAFYERLGFVPIGPRFRRTLGQRS